MDGALAGRVFPTVRTLALHRNAFDLVRCCPNVERLTLLGSFSGLSPVQGRLLRGNSPHLRAFTCRPVSAGHVEALAELMPLLYEIPPLLGFRPGPSILKLLSLMKNVIKIELAAATEKAPNPSQRTEELVRAKFKWSCAAVVPIHTVTTDMYPCTSPEALSEIVLRIRTIGFGNDPIHRTGEFAVKLQ
ncbi:hypothetical protein DFH09DRAFT_1071683 [Mycena vulgaris]|nr:hypothetical protein DFH09DRAFT_1071683 [Mycena vulgaris]